MTTPSHITTLISQIQARLPDWTITARPVEGLPFWLDQRKVQDPKEPHRYHIETVKVPKEPETIWYVDFTPPEDFRGASREIERHLACARLSYLGENRQTSRAEDIVLYPLTGYSNGELAQLAQARVLTDTATLSEGFNSPVGEVLIFPAGPNTPELPQGSAILSQWERALARANRDDSANEVKAGDYAYRCLKCSVTYKSEKHAQECCTDE